MDRDQLTIRSKLENTGLDEIESLAEIESIRNSPKFKESIALLVIMTFCNPAESFYTFHERLLRVFLSITGSEDPNGGRTFGRPIFRKNQHHVNSGEQACLCSWTQERSVSVDIPERYREGFKTALMYLLTTDVNRYFVHHRPADDAKAAIEIPCFLEMFQQSSPNNRNKFDALCGEYLALIGLSFANGCMGPEWTYGCVTSKFDFFVKQNNREIGVSVKSVNFCTVQHFCNPSNPDLWGQSSASNAAGRARRKRQRTDDEDETNKIVLCHEGENVLLHSCQCQDCMLRPIRTISVRMEKQNIEGQMCRQISLGNIDSDCKEKFEEIVQNWLPGSVTQQLGPVGDPDSDDEDDDEDEDENEELAVIHLVSARLFYELRYAFCYFNQETFRSVRFKLRDCLIARLVSTGDAAVESTRPALIDRTG